MKGIVITTDSRAYVKSFSHPLHKSLGEAVGGLIENVYPRGLPNPLMMVVNEEGLIRQLPINPIASHWYGTQHHGWSICGDVVVMAIGHRNGETDVVGLSDVEVDWVLTTLRSIGAKVEKEATA